MTSEPEPVPAVRWFLGVPFTPCDLADTARRVAAHPTSAPFVYVSTPNAQHVVRVAHGDRLFMQAHDRAWLVVNDSTILRLLSRKLFHQDLPLAAGSDLTAYLLAHYIKPDDYITIMGGNDEVERRLRAQFGLLHIARFDPPMGFYHHPAEIERCVDFILQHPARYVFLAVGVPQSETIARHVLDRGGAVGVGLCVGSSLSFATGVVRRAPPIFRRLHAEALHRLLLNPRRHAKRVFVESLPVLWIAFRTWLTPQARQPHLRADRK